MTRQEFETRTLVTNVSNQEFEAIHAVYMASDLDKDEFCKMWCKMNASRVSRAKYEIARKKAEEEAREMAWKIYRKLIDATNIEFADNILTNKEKAFLELYDIEMEALNYNGIRYFQNNFDVACEINRTFKFVA